jgi:hypothetical protein
MQFDKKGGWSPYWIEHIQINTRNLVPINWIKIWKCTYSVPVPTTPKSRSWKQQLNTFPAVKLQFLLLFETAFSFHEIVLTIITLYRSVCKEHSKSISSGAQYVALEKRFSHPSLVLDFFPYPTMLPSEHVSVSHAYD